MHEVALEGVEADTAVRLWTRDCAQHALRICERTYPLDGDQRQRIAAACEVADRYGDKQATQRDLALAMTDALIRIWAAPICLSTAVYIAQTSVECLTLCAFASWVAALCAGAVGEFPMKLKPNVALAVGAAAAEAGERAWQARWLEFYTNGAIETPDVADDARDHGQHKGTQ